MSLRSRRLAVALSSLPALIASAPAWAQDAPPVIDSGDTAWVLAASALVCSFVLHLYSRVLLSKNSHSLYSVMKMMGKLMRMARHQMSRMSLRVRDCVMTDFTLSG